ncbi:MAG: hypothetical protein HZB24_01095 [Desulfobacterales bacterium]|nr:hypothetical protein [Desulfobacterales bacterium]
MIPLAFVARTIGRLARNRIPPQLVVQITNRCNACCPQCGMRRGAEIARRARNACEDFSSEPKTIISLTPA